MSTCVEFVKKYWWAPFGLVAYCIVNLPFPELSRDFRDELLLLNDEMWPA